MAAATAIAEAPTSNGEERPKKSERVPPMNSNMAAIIGVLAYAYLNALNRRTLTRHGA